MRLKYPAYYRRAALYWILSAALLAVFGFAIYLIFVERGFDAVPSDARNSASISLFFILIGALYLAVRGIFLISAGRKLRRIRRDNTPQPIFSGSWSSEEVVTLARTYPRAPGWIYLLFGCAAFFTFGTPAMSATVAIVVEITLDPSRLMSRDTIASLLPLILLLIAFSLFAGGIASYLAVMKSSITADERGIVVAGRRRTRTIAWDEIALFVRLTRTEYPDIAGSYALMGRRKYVIFDISGVEDAPSVNVTNGSSSNRSILRFEGGYQQYAKDARQLIERIQRRTRLELRDISSELLRPERHAFVALESLTLEELAVMPVADQSLQPTMMSKSVAAFVELVTHISWRSRLRGLLASVAVMEGIVAITSMPLLADQIVYQSHSDDILVFVVVGVAILAALMAMVFSLIGRQRKQQAIAASESVVMSRGLSGVVIPWREVRAWGVLPAAPDHKWPTIYIVMSETRSIIWSEPDGADLDGSVRHGDRKAAYRARAAQLHATIALRTGLPLREIRLEDTSTTNV